MTQLTINIEDKAMVSVLKKLISELNGVSIASVKKNRIKGIDKAFEDIRNGHISGPFDSVEQLMKHLNE